MHSVILTELGIAIFDGKNCIKTFAFSNPSADFVSIKKGILPNGEIKKILSGLNTPLAVNDQSLVSILKRSKLDAQLMSQPEMAEISSAKPKILADAGFCKDADEALEKLRDFAMQLSSAKVSEVSQSPDLHIIQAINTLDETDKIINGMSSRIREWYGLHFPELDNVIDSIQGYSQIVLGGMRGDLTEKTYQDAGFPDSKVEMLSIISQKSRGGEISDQNLAIVQSLAKQILELFELRKTLEEHIEKQMRQIAPNLSAILGTSVGARILARAGSLKKLATIPASTIQVLGAEKALFRALKTGSQPPKHGILFQHPSVHAAPQWQRGKIARAIAAKAAIGARVDLHGAGLNQTLMDQLNIRVTEIDKKYKNPPERKPIPQQQMQKPKIKHKKFKKKKRRRFGRR